MKTGDGCPQCKIGHVSPSGERYFKEEQRGGPKQEYIVFVCDKCGHKHHELLLPGP